LKHGLRCCTCRSCFHNSNGVLETIAQGVWIEGGLCEFARAQQQRHQHQPPHEPPTIIIITTTISVRAHDDRQDQSLGFGFLKHGLRCCTCRSCFHNSNCVLETIAQGVRIESGLCEFARARQQSNSDTNHMCVHNSHRVFRSLAQAARIEAGLSEFAFM
jgi:hypothetical protein